MMILGHGKCISQLDGDGPRNSLEGDRDNWVTSLFQGCCLYPGDCNYMISGHQDAFQKHAHNV